MNCFRVWKFLGQVPRETQLGLNFRISGLTAMGSYGHVIWLSIGVAEILNRQLENMVDYVLKRTIGHRARHYHRDSPTITTITLLDKAERLLEYEESLKAKFSNLEIVLGRLNAQRDTFQSSLAGIQNIFSQKK